MMVEAGRQDTQVFVRMALNLPLSFYTFYKFWLKQFSALSGGLFFKF